MTEAGTSEAITAVAESDTTGLRVVCMCCKRDLPHSNRNATRTSHGLCNPLCAEAEKFGYGKYLKKQQSNNQ